MGVDLLGLHRPGRRGAVKICHELDHVPPLHGELAKDGGIGREGGGATRQDWSSGNQAPRVLPLRQQLRFFRFQGQLGAAGHRPGRITAADSVTAGAVVPEKSRRDPEAVLHGRRAEPDEDEKRRTAASAPTRRSSPASRE